ncbi:MAG TPA: hypothetical protein VFY43_07175 [Candidatus Limnocylindria bacterium]|nr:hypothetical protein [Candidatus Limnocylindria bacterium]
MRRLAGRHLSLGVRIRLFSLFLELIACPGTSPGANGTTDHGAGRTSHRATQDGTTDGTRRTACAGSDLLVTLGRLTGNGTAGGTNGAADRGAHRATDHATDYRAAHRASRAANGLARMLLVVRSGAVRIAAVPIEHLVISPRVVHGKSSLC